MNFSTILNRVVATSVVATAVTLSPALSNIAQAQTLSGAGATFPNPLYQRYSKEVRTKHPELKVNYQGIGSSGGVRQITQGTVDFGGSDAAMKDSEIKKVEEKRGRSIILVPTAGGAVSVVHNVPGVSELRLSRQTLPLIFSGEITKWNDNRIKADNSGVNLPNIPIRFVVRADGSGTTYIFTSHLSKISGYFKGRVGANKAPDWNLNNVLKGKGNAGVAARVRQTPGSIGYVEFSYAKKNNLNSALLQNKNGEFVAPSLAGAKAALASANFPDNYRVFVTDPERGYPIVGLTWMMVYTKYDDSTKAEAVKKWINWVLTDGQKFNEELSYTSIPSSVVERVLNTVNTTVK